MVIGIFFWLLALTCCAHAVRFGGQEGRWACALIVLASLLSLPANLAPDAWGGPEIGLLLVDAGLLGGLAALMMCSRRYWPIWMTGLHLVAVVTHVSTLLVPEFDPRIYRALGSFWAVPVLLSLLIGVELDRRAEHHPITGESA